MKTISMICKDCGGTLDVNEDQNVVFCPYCGSKKLIVESDEVKKERLKLESKLVDRQMKIDEREAMRQEKKDNQKQLYIVGVIILICFILSQIMMRWWIR